MAALRVAGAQMEGRFGQGVVGTDLGWLFFGGFLFIFVLRALIAGFTNRA